MRTAVSNPRITEPLLPADHLFITQPLLWEPQFPTPVSRNLSYQLTSLLETTILANKLSPKENHSSTGPSLRGFAASSCYTVPSPSTDEPTALHCLRDPASGGASYYRSTPSPFPCRQLLLVTSSWDSTQPQEIQLQDSSTLYSIPRAI